jgi:hypothetical protein
VRKFGVKEIPFSVVVGADGTVLAINEHGKGWRRVSRGRCRCLETRRRFLPRGSCCSAPSRAEGPAEGDRRLPNAGPRGAFDSQSRHPSRRSLRDAEQPRGPARVHRGPRLPPAAAAEALVRGEPALREKGYGLLVFDGYRPWRVTKIFLGRHAAREATFVADPRKDPSTTAAAPWTSRLYDLRTGKEVEMPSVYDEMSERAYPTYAGRHEPRSARRAISSRTPWSARGSSSTRTSGGTSTSRTGGRIRSWTCRFRRIARSAPPRPAARLSRTATVVDLTHPFDAATLYWPNAPSASS